MRYVILALLALITGTAGSMAVSYFCGGDWGGLGFIGGVLYPVGFYISARKLQRAFAAEGTEDLGPIVGLSLLRPMGLPWMWFCDFVYWAWLDR